MIGLSEFVSLARARAAAVPFCWRSAAVVYLDGQILAGDRPHFRGPAAVHAAQGQAGRSGRSGRISRPKTDFGLRGSYLRARTDEQAGVIVYCHEYLSDRWSFQPYLDHLRDLGYQSFHVRLSQSRNERSRSRLCSAAMDDRA